MKSWRDSEKEGWREGRNEGVVEDEERKVKEKWKIWKKGRKTG